MTDRDDARIGVLALQGDFAEHVAALSGLGVRAREVRLPADLEGLDGLIIPGGESTTIGKLADRWGLVAPLQERLAADWPVWGTCAGLIFLARDVVGALPDQVFLEAMDIRVQRNAFGRQRESFEIELEIPAIGPPLFHAVFIRAPLIEAVGPATEVLARLPDGRIVAARQRRLLATAFHPELTGDLRMHKYFATMAREARKPAP
ncbi:MAG: pyridoxal 5'-phosphate synthase glutaminase subunit PdxT [Dehalococcoidia bacterium]|nr:pyridoxal 5'-phosphate synthase glutaminase subunit PdxT [Dehalococcoidia bacterium]